MSIITKGRVSANLPERIHSPTLEAELRQAFGDGIGWAVEYDNQKNIIGIQFEYDQALGYDPAEITDFFKAVSLEPDKDDDFREVEKRQEAERDLAQRVADLEARVSAIEGKR